MLSADQPMTKTEPTSWDFPYSLRWYLSLAVFCLVMPSDVAIDDDVIDWMGWFVSTSNFEQLVYSSSFKIFIHFHLLGRFRSMRSEFHIQLIETLQQLVFCLVLTIRNLSRTNFFTFTIRPLTFISRVFAFLVLLNDRYSNVFFWFTEIFNDPVTLIVFGFYLWIGSFFFFQKCQSIS